LGSDLAYTGLFVHFGFDDVDFGGTSSESVDGARVILAGTGTGTRGGEVG